MACHWVFRTGWFCVKAKQVSGLVPLRSFGLLCVDHIAIFWCQHTFCTSGGTTIVTAVHNNKDILMVPYKDLRDEDKNVISKAIEEFKNKCLLSYTKTRDNKVI